eukprot:CAMPEP_0117528688 /NCGR_PEP_ID=MMETSP0784-20121206/37443_1 /TAXON_ID=39447 /ORGANISM="" /LENGTH=211 /DNA_ID=CAMNT_0005324981 /DNA_START=319 /DNA_END=953 /DNA_ORIENTATION=-
MNVPQGPLHIRSHLPCVQDLACALMVASCSSLGTFLNCPSRPGPRGSLAPNVGLTSPPSLLGLLAGVSAAAASMELLGLPTIAATLQLRVLRLVGLERRADPQMTPQTPAAKVGECPSQPHIANDALQRNVLLKAERRVATKWATVVGELRHMRLAQELVALQAVDALVAHLKAHRALEKLLVHGARVVRSPSTRGKAQPVGRTSLTCQRE